MWRKFYNIADDKNLIFEILSSEFYLRPLYRWALSRLHELGPDAQREYQFCRLKLILRHAYHNIPYWRNSIDPKVFNGQMLDVQAFNRLAVLTRETLKIKLQEFMVKDIRRYKWRDFFTSGSTGIPQRFLAKKVYFQKMVAAEEFHARRFGLKNFKRYGYLLPKPHLFDLVTHFDVNKDPFDWDNRKLLNSWLKEKKIQVLAAVLNRLLILEKSIKWGEVRPNLKFVMSGSEYMSAETRYYLERVLFRCPVYNKYACAEAGMLGIECPTTHLGFHIDPVNFYLEIVDDGGCPVKNENSGRVIITTFNNRLMPLIRYDLGDTGRWIKGECGCGLKTPRLLFEGRRLEYLKLPDGRKYSATSIGRALDRYVWHIIRKYQLVQESLHKLTFRFVPTESYRPHHGVFIKDCIRRHLRNPSDVEVKIQTEPFLDNLKNGKYVIFKSEIKHEPPTDN